MTSLKISIAMCTYNGEKYLQEQLDSIARQSRLPDELIICDDNSSDMTASIIHTFAASALFPVKLYKNDVNIGSTSNFEQAVRFCGGDVIVLSDQDDVWHLDKLKLLEQVFLDSEETGAVFTNGNVVSESLRPLGYTLWDSFLFEKKDRSYFKSGREFEVLLNHNLVTGATMAFRSSLRNLILPIPCTWVHDAWIVIIISMNNRICALDKCLIEYRQHENQQFGGQNRSCMESIKLSISNNHYDMQIKAYKELQRHVQKLKLNNGDYCLKRIAGKIAHLAERNIIYKSGGVVKIIKVLQELLSRRYCKYSRGYLSACKDLFM